MVVRNVLGCWTRGLLSADLAQKARGIRAPAQYIPHTVDGSIMSTVCDLIADCDIGGQIIKQHHFTVVKDCTYPAILGMDLFSVLNVKIHMGNIQCSQSADTINTKNRLTRQSGSTPVVGRIYATRNVEVPGRSMFVFQGKVEAHIDPGTPVMVDAALDQGSERLGLGCGRVLDTVRNEGHVLMHMINPSTEVCRVQKGTCVGTFSTVVEDAVFVGQLSSEKPDTGTKSKNEEVAVKRDVISRRLANAADLTASEKHRLYKKLHDHGELFSIDGELGHTSVMEHAIPTEDATPIHQQPRRVPYNRLPEVERFVNEGLETEVIRPSKSPWASPLVLVKKEDGSTRFCVDFRRLNDVTVGDSFPVPRIDDSLRALGGAKIFSTIDLTKGFWQVPVREDDKPKTAFTCHKGLFEFNTMPFGLKGAPATFQRLMTAVLGDLNWQIVLIYLDDIIVYSRSFEEHLEHLELVFTKLHTAGLKLHPDKCAFGRQEVKYLGHLVGRKGVRPDPEKVRAIQNYPRPQSVAEVRRFLGIASYYRRFIDRFADIAAPLHAITQKQVSFDWTSQCETAFKTLQGHLLASPILAYPDFSQSAFRCRN